MRNHKFYNLKTLTITTLLLLCQSLFAESYQVELIKGSRLWIEGGSTLHDYEAEAKVIDIDAKLSMDGTSSSNFNLLEALVQNPQTEKFIISLPVKKLKSPTIGLSGEMHKALKKKECPEIEFTLTDYKAVTTDNQSIYNINVTGQLLVAGETNPLTLQSKLEIKDDYIVLSGEREILMSEFGVEPPVLLFLKTNDAVTIKWNLLLGI